MKCVKTKGGEVKRVADAEAEAMVRSGEATFTSRDEWRKVRGEVQYGKGDKRPGWQKREKAEVAKQQM